MPSVIQNRPFEKPFLKWVGGKTQIINDICNKVPKSFNSYHEIFLGGGSVLFAILSMKKQGMIEIKDTIYACDLNERLINTYKHVQSNKDELYQLLKKYYEEYDSINGESINRSPETLEEAKTSKESYFYWSRSKFNNSGKESLESAALFIFINKTCFRGIYRENKSGIFNVPFGNYKKTPAIITKADLDYVSELIKDVVFVVCDFSVSIKNVKKGDFVYLDPPYAPENLKSFVTYNADGFNLETHKKLFSEIKKVGEKANFVLSNSNVDLVTSNFCDFNCEVIEARRAINSKKPDSKTKEVIIWN